MHYIGEEEIQAIRNVFQKQKLFRHQGNSRGECDLFEEEFAKRFASKHALILSSGTNALVLSLLAAGLNTGDEVLVPAYTFVATASAVVQAGCIPVLVDIDLNLSMDVEDARRKVNEKTKAIILVHMDGLVANILEIEKLCREKNLIFVEDAAQSMGSSWKGQMIGTFGDYGCFSLNENKTLTCGEGGLLITNHSESFQKALCLHDGPLRFNSVRRGEFRDLQPFVGLSMRVSEIQGAIMRVQLKRLDFILQQLAERRNILMESLSSLKRVRVIEGYSKANCGSSFHLQFQTLEEGISICRDLQSQGHHISPVTTRPAHVSWKWSEILGKNAHIQEGLNPYLRVQKEYNYSAGNHLSSVDILSRTYKFDISLSQTVDSYIEMSKSIRSYWNQLT